jgi:dethiobiotin synthase
MSIFVTGTDTGVGKTVVSAWLCLRTNATYWKPIQTGNDSDRDVITKFSPHTKIISEMYKLKAPLSPYDAANLEGIEIKRKLLERCLENTVIEGAGGALVPIGEDFLMADLVKTCGARVLLVAKSKLGMINHSLMTTEVLKSRNIDVLGIIVNGEIENHLKCTIEKFSGLKILAIIPCSGNLIGTLQNMPLPTEILETIK